MLVDPFRSNSNSNSKQQGIETPAEQYKYSKNQNLSRHLETLPAAAGRRAEQAVAEAAARRRHARPVVAVQEVAML